jgi:hypothetical protein
LIDAINSTRGARRRKMPRMHHRVRRWPKVCAKTPFRDCGKHQPVERPDLFCQVGAAA